MRRLAEFNERLAVAGTRAFGSMGAVWACLGWSLLPLLPGMAWCREAVLYASAGVVQLVALPLLMVGGIVLNRVSEERAAEDHATIRAEFQLLKEEHAEARRLRREVHARLERIERALGVT